MGMEGAPGRRLLRAAMARGSRVPGDVFFAAQDVALVVVCFASVLLVRYGGQVPPKAWSGFGGFLPIAVAVYLSSHWVAGLYGQIWRFASILEARRLLASGLASMTILLSVGTIGPRLIPISVVIAGSVFTTMVVGTLRFGTRLFAYRRRETLPAGLRIVVAGAGGTGAMLLREMRENPRGGMVPVALVDDDPRKQGRMVLGVRVLGSLEDLPRVCRDTQAHQIVLAIPTANRGVMRQVANMAAEADVVLRVMPDEFQPLHRSPTIQSMRDVRIEDLIGRQQVVTDLQAVQRMIGGRRVLITGGGGSIGSEMATQVAACSPGSLMLLDHDETHLHDVAATLPFEPVLLLADIRDRDRLQRIFVQLQPDIVFHAAAHKHVPLLELHPCEAARTNVIGTANVLAAAAASGVERFVFVSTDKAVQPASVMGASKRLAEHLVLSAATAASTKYCGVRFGNVLGSRGSVIPTFMRQIEAGGPVTVTSPHMTRYFMSIPEAVQLVLQAAAMARGGEIFMLEMGEPVPILDLAKRMIRMSGHRLGSDIELRVIGARPGEKIEEELRLPDEAAEKTSNPSIVRLRPAPLDSNLLADAVALLQGHVDRGKDLEVRRELLDMAHRPASWWSGSPFEQFERRPQVIDLTATEAVTVTRHAGEPA